MADFPLVSGIVRGLQAGWQAYKATSGGSTTVSRVLAANAANAPDYPDLSKYENQAKVAIADPWLYTSWTKIQRGLGLVDFNVSTYTAEKKTGIVDHPIESLFRKPNTFQSRTEFRDMASGYLLINGNVYYFLNQPAPGAPPVEILILNPAYVRIVAGSDASHPVKGYVYTVGGIEIPLDASQVIHRRFFNPKDTYYGLSPIEACALSVQADLGMAQWNRNFFTRDNAIPSGLVNIKSMVSDTDYERIQREWRDAYGGNSRKTAFIRGADLSFEATGTTQSDMDFINGRTFEKELIFSVYGIPPGSMAVNATEANANAAAETFTRETLWPLAIAEGEKWTAELAPLYGDNLVVEPEDFRVKDRKAELLEMQAAGSYLEINEVREKYWNLPPVSWGNKPATGAQALPGGVPAFGKPAIDATQSQIEAEDGGGKSLYLEDGIKALSSDEQRKWWFANNPQFAAQGTVPHMSAEGDSATNQAKFETFVNDNKHGVAKAIWDQDMVKYGNDGHIVVDKPATKDAASALVRDSRDATVSKDYLISGSRDLYGYQGTDQQVENQINHDYAVKAQGALMAAHVGDVTLTDAQHTRLTSIAHGNYLNDKYSQYASGERGTAVGTGGGSPRTRGGSDGYESAAAADFRNMRMEWNGAKAMDETIIIPRVYVSRPMRKEIAQFEKYAAKGKSVDSFSWKHTDIALIIGLKALVDCDLTDLLDSDALKAITLQSKLEKKIATAMTAYFDGLTQRLVTGVRHVYSATKALPDKKAFLAYFSAAWWAGELKNLSAAIVPIMHDAVDDAAVQAANAIEIATGVSVDNSVFYKLASDWANQYTDDILKGFNTTTQDGIGAIIGRYAADPSATLDDLISAIQESRLVGPDRAKTFAVTEGTRAFAAGNYIAGDEIADNLDIENAVNADDVANVSPAHPNDRCPITPEIQYDKNDKPIGMDYRWTTLHDELVCIVCSGRDGKLVSEILAEGL